MREKIDEMPDRVVKLSSLIPEGYEIMVVSVLEDHLFGLDGDKQNARIGFVFRRPLSESLMKEPKILNFRMPDTGEKVIGYDLYEFIKEIMAGRAPKGLHFMHLSACSYTLNPDFFLLSKQAEALFKEWAYCSPKWDVLFHDPKKILNFISQDTLANAYNRMHEIVRKHQEMSKEWNREQETYILRREVSRSLRTTAHLLMMLGDACKYPEGTKKSLRQFEGNKDAERKAFRETLNRIVAGELKDHQIRHLAQKLGNSLLQMKKLFKPSIELEDVDDFIKLTIRQNIPA